MNEELKQAANAVFLLESQGVKFYENVCKKDEIFANEKQVNFWLCLFVHREKHQNKRYGL